MEVGIEKGLSYYYAASAKSMVAYSCICREPDGSLKLFF